jgi:hypothetical protein
LGTRQAPDIPSGVLTVIIRLADDSGKQNARVKLPQQRAAAAI